MTDVIETREQDGYKIEIWQDENPENPRDWDNQFSLVIGEGRNIIANETGMGVFNIGNIGKEHIETIIAQSGRCLFWPIYMHGYGYYVRFTFGPMEEHPDPDTWECNGFAVISMDKVEEEHGWKKITKSRKADLEKWLEGELDELAHYMNGECYGYTVTRDGEDIESLGGYFDISDIQHEIDATILGHKEYMAKQAREGKDLELKMKYERELLLGKYPGCDVYFLILSNTDKAYTSDTQFATIIWAMFCIKCRTVTMTIQATKDTEVLYDQVIAYKGNPEVKQ